MSKQKSNSISLDSKIRGLCGAITVLILAVAALPVIGSLVTDSVSADSADAEITVDITPLIALSLDKTTVSLPIDADTVGEEEVTGDLKVTVNTNSTYGYNITMQAQDNGYNTGANSYLEYTTKLDGTDGSAMRNNSSYRINSVAGTDPNSTSGTATSSGTGTTLSSSTANQWGYSWVAGTSGTTVDSYFAIPGDTDIPIRRVTSLPNTDATQVTKLHFGTFVNDQIPSGNYARKLMVTAVAIPRPTTNS